MSDLAIPNLDLMQSPGVNAVVLSGGGANGAYEVGVLKALMGGASPATNFKPLRPGIITGTSIGAFNASALVSRLRDSGLSAITELEDIWLKVIPRDPLTNHNHIFRFRGNPFEYLLNPESLVTDPLRPLLEITKDAAAFMQDFLISASSMFKAQGGLVGRLANLINFSALITNEPSFRLVEKVISARTMRESNVKLRIASTNWDLGIVRVFDNWDMTDDYAVKVVISSTAIPSLFPSVLIDGDSYVDGGVILNTPILPAIRARADTLHLIYLDPSVKSIPVGSLQSTLDMMTRMFSVQFAAKMNEDVKRAALVNSAISAVDGLAKASGASPEMISTLRKIAGIEERRTVLIHRYHPRDDLGGGILGWLDFSRERNARLIERGFRDGVEHDCNRSGCVMADGTILSAPTPDIESDT